MENSKFYYYLFIWWLKFVIHQYGGHTKICRRHGSTSVYLRNCRRRV